MKKIILSVFIILFSLLIVAQFSSNKNFHIKKNKEVEEDFKAGDIIFQSNNGRQSKAVKLATHSTFSHVGMIINHNGELQVLEAVEPVRIVSLEQWIAHGIDQEYEVVRLKKKFDFKAKNNELAQWIKISKGKHYDLLFEWSDEKLYCSELVWKVYKEVYEIELCELKKLKDFDLSHPFVKVMLKERYGDNLPLNQSVVAPEDIYKSELIMKLPI